MPQVISGFKSNDNEKPLRPRSFSAQMPLQDWLPDSSQHPVWNPESFNWYPQEQTTIGPTATTMEGQERSDLTFGTADIDIHFDDTEFFSSAHQGPVPERTIGKVPIPRNTHPETVRPRGRLPPGQSSKPPDKRAQVPSGKAGARCASRKIKCDGKRQCDPCKNANAECHDVVRSSERLTGGHRFVTCDRCFRLKVKCDRGEPCGKCIEFRVDCTWERREKQTAKRERLKKAKEQREANEESQSENELATSVNSVDV